MSKTQEKISLDGWSINENGTVYEHVLNYKIVTSIRREYCDYKLGFNHKKYIELFGANGKKISNHKSLMDAIKTVNRIINESKYNT